MRSIGEFDDFDIRIEDMVQLDNDWLKYKVIENAEDFGTRPSGKALKTDVLNIIKRMSKPIILDFADIAIVGSSFIDEFIAKMYVELGSVKFNQLISIVNMNDELVHLCNRAIAMRINQAWETKE